jgi:phosphoribosyl 1,2-cyclic phosphodiesterase
MRFASLGSGSSGNALIVEVGRTRVMLDCGFSATETEARLGRLGLSPGDLAGIVVTHEHSDHVGGVVRFARKHRLPVWLTYGTFSMLQVPSHLLPTTHLIDSHSPFPVADMEIEPFPVPHDAREPVQFVFGDGARRLGVLTDTGSSTAHIEATLSGCDALVLECNHDDEMLRNGSYPPGLKQRIAGRLGHMENRVAAALLARLDCSRLQHVIAAHLSEQNNSPGLAKDALASALGCDRDWIGVADQENGFGWRAIA